MQSRTLKEMSWILLDCRHLCWRVGLVLADRWRRTGTRHLPLLRSRVRLMGYFEFAFAGRRAIRCFFRLCDGFWPLGIIIRRLRGMWAHLSIVGFLRSNTTTMAPSPLIVCGFGCLILFPQSFDHIACNLHKLFIGLRRGDMARVHIGDRPSPGLIASQTPLDRRFTIPTIFRVSTRSR